MTLRFFCKIDKICKNISCLIIIPFILHCCLSSFYKYSGDNNEYDEKDSDTENTDSDDGAPVHFPLLTPGDVTFLIIFTHNIIIFTRNIGHVTSWQFNLTCKEAWNGHACQSYIAPGSI